MDWKLLIYLITFVILGGGIMKVGIHTSVWLVKKDKNIWAGMTIICVSILTMLVMVYLEKWIY